MTTLSTIKNLISKLKREELKSLFKYLRYYQDSNTASKGKAIQLLEILIERPELTSKDVQIAIYGKENYQAFNKLLSRTKDKIYEVLLFDQNLAKPYYSDRNRVVFEIRKKLVQSEVLYLRGMTDELASFQNKIISKAKDYELYDSLIQALQAKQRFLGFRFGKKAFDKIEKEILSFEQSRNAALRARSFFTSIGAKINQSVSPQEYKAELKDAIDKMEGDFEVTQSATVGYYLFLLQTEWFHIHEQYLEAESTLRRLLELVLNNTSIYTRVRHGEVLMNLANNEILLRDFHLAVKNAVDAKAFYETNSVPLDVAKEIEFYARFYKGEVDLAEKIIDETYNSSRTSNTPFLFSKRAYLFACIKTIKGDIAKSNELLLDVKEIDKDKEGWNLGRRMLTIINRIELHELESADLKVLGLEKFIKRILKFRHVRKRDVIILRILLKLINEGFDFEKVYNQRKRYFDLLEGDDPEYRWKIKSPELLVFHEWFKSKMITQR
ncbi:MAG TPA: hypothetical protein VE933_12365 [Chitinophagaceae bacterium]|nr:hypothetical protein [Chitinophagaceae bacterium]